MELSFRNIWNYLLEKDSNEGENRHKLKLLSHILDRFPDLDKLQFSKYHNKSLLHLAIDKQNPEALKLLIKSFRQRSGDFFDLEEDEDYLPPLHYALSLNPSEGEKYVNILIQAGALFKNTSTEKLPRECVNKRYSEPSFMARVLRLEEKASKTSGPLQKTTQNSKELAELRREMADLRKEMVALRGCLTKLAKGQAPSQKEPSAKSANFFEGMSS